MTDVPAQQLLAKFAKERPSEAAFLALSYDNALTRARARGIAPDVVIDIGAAKGDWSQSAAKIWPDARYVMMEAKELWRSELESVCAKHPRFEFVIAAAGPKTGTARFRKTEDPFGGAVVNDAVTNVPTVEVPLLRVDDIVADRGIKGSILLKLDTHGTEIDIFKGAETTLKSVDLICVETYGIVGVRFPKICLELARYGFEPCDLAEPLFRRKDGMLWQIDLLFMRSDHPSFKDMSWV